jgi:hypothetical protein
MGVAEVGVSHFSTSECKEFSADFIARSRWFVQALLALPGRDFDR